MHFLCSIRVSGSSMWKEFCHLVRSYMAQTCSCLLHVRCRKGACRWRSRSTIVMLLINSQQKPYEGGPLWGIEPLPYHDVNVGSCVVPFYLTNYPLLLPCRNCMIQNFFFGRGRSPCLQLCVARQYILRSPPLIANRECFS